MRDPALLKTFALQPGDADSGRTKNLAPTRVERDPASDEEDSDSG